MYNCMYNMHVYFVLCMSTLLSVFSRCIDIETLTSFISQRTYLRESQ